MARFARTPEVSSTLRGIRLRLGLLVAVSAGLAVAASGTAQAKNKRNLVVMTQNLYLGSSLAPATDATTPADFLIGVATIYGTVQFTDFPSRANAIADEIEAGSPDIIGLQEVSNWTAFGPASIAPSFDFLAILQQALVDRGLSYSVAAVAHNADITVPLVAPCGSTVVGACLLRFQDRDVILVNDDTPDLEWSNPQSGHYVTQQVVVTPVGPLSFDRGWCSIDATLEGKKFRFANTHLETETYPDVQEEQGQEFLAGPAKGKGAVIATGDFNSAADGSTTTTYADLTRSYFDDAWNPSDPGFSCCQNSTLTNFPSELSSRIDLVLTHAASRALDAELIGDTPFEVVPPLWPSDHAGVLATLRIH